MPNFKGGGYYPETKELKPITDFDFEVEVLDAGPAAAEASMLRSDIWVKQLFADDEVFGRFMEGLAQYDTHSRITTVGTSRCFTLLMRSTRRAS